MDSRFWSLASADTSWSSVSRVLVVGSFVGAGFGCVVGFVFVLAILVVIGGASWVCSPAMLHG